MTNEQIEGRRKNARVGVTFGVVVLVLLIAASLATSFLIGRGFQQSAQRAQEQTLSLSQEVQNACKEGSVQIGGQDICASARQAQQQVESDVVAGPPGPRGIQGEPGMTGARGPAGQDGADGEDGSDGPPGTDGADGATGDAGAAGEPGPDGEDGNPGAAGEDGADGSTGPRGATGASGQDGAPGPAGPSGPAGPAGAIGPSGPAGPAGAAGSDGVGIRTIQCTGAGADSRWEITLTNGNTAIASGPCKATTPAEATPTPEESP